MKKTINKKVQNILDKIAKEHLFIETLETRNRDGLDFHDLSVAGITKALESAYYAGYDAGVKDSDVAPIIKDD